LWPEIPGDPQKNKPDLVVIEGSQRKITVVDVIIPFEGEADCLQEARQAKEAKYSFLKTFLEGKSPWMPSLLELWGHGTQLMRKS